ncbi:MAG TPA: helix-turn-helix domain-containing protein, partial [Candidatus Methylomirabilis sp.]
RLNVISIEMPPLRERREDIPLLATSFLSLFAARAGRNAMRLTPEAMDALLTHTWPGNVRELENVMERAVALATSDEVRAENLPPNLLQRGAPLAVSSWQVPHGGLDLEKVVAETEQALMRDALEKAGWVQTKAAELLGINFRSFRYRARKYGLDREIRDRTHGTV